MYKVINASYESGVDSMNNMFNSQNTVPDISAFKWTLVAQSIAKISLLHVVLKLLF